MCIGCGRCEQLCRSVFSVDPTESNAYVRSGATLVRDMVGVPCAPEFEPRVRRAARECPGECIFLTDAGGAAIDPFSAVAADDAPESVDVPG
jgi:ferredoxin